MSPLRALHPSDGGIGELLDMIARKGPQYMRCGDAACHSDTQPDGWRFVTADDRRAFADGLRAGKTMHEVAAETGFHYQTVAEHTRSVRKAIGYDGRRRNNL